jgi:hypothetical protein
MSLLIDSLPDTVKIGGKAVPIDTDFRTSIRYEMLLTKQFNQLSENELLLKILSLFFPNDLEYVTENLQETIDAIMWFYRCGEPESEDTGKGKKATEIYSYEYDAPYIYAAFLDQYGIDLNSIDYLHWWKFRALFSGLGENNEIVKIMSIRQTEITRDMPKEQAKQLRKLKRIYRLPDMRSAEQKDADFADSFSALF